MKYKITFRIPPTQPIKHFFDGVEYSIIKIAGAPARAEIKINAVHERQAWVIANSIARKNAWALSGQPVKVGF